MVKKISDARILKLMEKENNQAKVAARLGITPAAVCKRLKKIGFQKTMILSTKEAENAVGKGLSAVGQLKKINESALNMLSQLEEEIQAIDEKEDESEDSPFKKNARDSKRQLLLQNLKEIREQVKTQMDIMKTLYDLKAMEEFQQEVIHCVNEVEPEASKRIIDALSKRTTL